MDISKLKKAANLLNGECHDTRCEECEFRVKIPCKPYRCGLNEGELLNEAVRIIEDLQERIDIMAADMPVHCKDCKYRPIQTEPGKAGFTLEFPYGYRCPCECEDGYYSWYPDDDWYCKYGERKDGEGEV